MSFAGGVFTRLYSYVADAAAGITAQPARFDADLNDMATGLTSCLLRDGTGTPTANIGWGGYRITGLADPVNPQDAATRNYVMITMVGLYLPVTGGTLTGGLIGTTAVMSGYVDSAATVRSTGSAVPATGVGVELSYTAGVGYVTAYDRNGSAFVPLAIRASTLNLTVNAQTAVNITAGNVDVPLYKLTVAGVEVGYKDVPQNPQAAAYTLTLTDRSEHIYYTGAAAVLTIPANATVAFPIGAATTIVNDGTGALSLTRAAGVTMKLVACACVKLKVTRKCCGINFGLLHRFAAIALFQQGQLVCVLGNFVRQLHQQASTLSGGDVPPDQIKAVARGAGGVVNVCRSAALNLVKHLAVRRVPYQDGFA